MTCLGQTKKDKKLVEILLTKSEMNHDDHIIWERKLNPSNVEKYGEEELTDKELYLLKK